MLLRLHRWQLLPSGEARRNQRRWCCCCNLDVDILEQPKNNCWIFFTLKHVNKYWDNLSAWQQIRWTSSNGKSIWKPKCAWKNIFLWFVFFASSSLDYVRFDPLTVGSRQDESFWYDGTFKLKNVFIMILISTDNIYHHMNGINYKAAKLGTEPAEFLLVRHPRFSRQWSHHSWSQKLNIK